MARVLHLRCCAWDSAWLWFIRQCAFLVELIPSFLYKVVPNSFTALLVLAAQGSELVAKAPRQADPDSSKLISVLSQRMREIGMKAALNMPIGLQNCTHLFIQFGEVMKGQLRSPSKSCCER